MAIQVFCNCGNSLSVGVQLAGKKVRCKGCGEVLRIPDVPLDESAEDDPTSGPDDYEVVSSVDATINCPTCGATASPEDTACLACGADLSSAGGPGFLAAVPRQYLLAGLAVVALIVVGSLIKIAWTSSRPGSYTTKGLAYLDAEDFPAAEDAFKQALTYEPAYRDALVGLAQTGVASKKGGLITRFVKQVLRKDLVTDDSQRGLMRLALARLLLEENNPKDASSQATSALEDDDSLAGEAYAIIGLAAADDGSADEAIEALEKSQAAHHKSTRLFRTLAKLYRDRKDYPKARAAAERAVDGDKENSTLWLEVAALRRLAGDTDAVAPALLQAIRFDETNAHAYSRLARVYLDQGKTDEAVKTAEKASSIAPDDVSVLVSLGRALLANDHPSESLKPLKKARKNAKPKSKSAWESAFYLGSALIQVDKRDEGMRMISEALRGQPDPALHLKAAAIALNEAESPNKAATILSKLIKSEPDNYEARVLMAEALAQRAHGRSKYDTGIRKHLNAAIKLNDTRRDAPMALGKHEFESLRPTKAIEAFDLGLRGNRRDKDLLFYKGWACIRAGRWDDAISALQLCLQVAPNFEDAKAKLEEAQEGKFYQRD